MNCECKECNHNEKATKLIDRFGAEMAVCADCILTGDKLLREKEKND